MPIGSVRPPTPDEAMINDVDDPDSRRRVVAEGQHRGVLRAEGETDDRRGDPHDRVRVADGEDEHRRDRQQAAADEHRRQTSVRRVNQMASTRPARTGPEDRRQDPGRVLTAQMDLVGVGRHPAGECHLGTDVHEEEHAEQHEGRVRAGATTDLVVRAPARRTGCAASCAATPRPIQELSAMTTADQQQVVGPSERCATRSVVSPARRCRSTGAARSASNPTRSVGWLHTASVLPPTSIAADAEPDDGEDGDHHPQFVHGRQSNAAATATIPAPNSRRWPYPRSYFLRPPASPGCSRAIARPARSRWRRCRRWRVREGAAGPVRQR